MVKLMQEKRSCPLPRRALLAKLRYIRTRQQEYFVCISLDGQQRIIARRTVFIGTLTSVLAHPREIFVKPLKENAYAVVIAHNHPSGDPTPSSGDIETTQIIAAAGDFLGIPVLDHIVVAKVGQFSFLKHGLLRSLPLPSPTEAALHSVSLE